MNVVGEGKTTTGGDEREARLLGTKTMKPQIQEHFHYTPELEPITRGVEGFLEKDPTIEGGVANDDIAADDHRPSLLSRRRKRRARMANRG